MILPAISIRQPWAFLICERGKDVENRTWACPQKYFGQLVLLHAGQSPIVPGHENFGDHVPPLCGYALPLGGVVGLARILGCVKHSTSLWAEPGQFHWLLAEARSLPFYPCKGRLGFFQVDYPHEVPNA